MGRVASEVCRNQIIYSLMGLYQILNFFLRVMDEPLKGFSRVVT
jgi:hypothetical protein